jgi:hypothetical protein
MNDAKYIGCASGDGLGGRFRSKRKSLFTLSSPRCKLPPLRARYCLPDGTELQGPMIRARIDAYPVSCRRQTP